MATEMEKKLEKVLMMLFRDIKISKVGLDIMDEKRTILFVTSNPGKLREAKLALNPYGLNVESFNHKKEFSEIQEIQSSELRHVAKDKLRKAVSIAKNSSNKIGVMVEDSGFFIQEIDGFPGVFSSYVYKTLGIEGILKALSGITNREACFKCVIGIHLDDQELFFEGECKGRVSEKPLGTNGFGFDPIFIPSEGNGNTFGEMNSREKQKFSHRGKAIESLRAHLQDRIQSPTSNQRGESGIKEET